MPVGVIGPGWKIRAPMPDRWVGSLFLLINGLKCDALKPMQENAFDLHRGPRASWLREGQAGSSEKLEVVTVYLFRT